MHFLGSASLDVLRLTDLRPHILMNIPWASLTIILGALSSVCVRIPIVVTSNPDPREPEPAISRGAHYPDVLDDPAPSVAYVNCTRENHDFELCLSTDDTTKIPRIESDLRCGAWGDLPLPALDLYVKSVPAGMSSSPTNAR